MSMTDMGNWAVDLKDVSAIYPMQGLEVVMAIIGIILWLGWHVWQFKHENATLADEVAKYGSEENRKSALDSD
jgi:predicted negative regulator of RcsB-dependent stress response